MSCLQASQSAFTAILADGTAVFWGDRPSFGDFDESPVREQLLSGSKAKLVSTFGLSLGSLILKV